jgi:5-methylthioribose kinase
VTFLDAGDAGSIERYAVARGLVHTGALPLQIARAGDGNMNLTLRITPAAGRPFILKQGRPWVEKYPHIPAPAERTLVEAAFYAAVQADGEVAGRMPTLLSVDRDNHVLALEDLGHGGDFTSIYAGTALPHAALVDLLAWLERLAPLPVPPGERAVFANRAMRALNHEHMFRFPLDPGNGLDLDGITPGLGGAAAALSADGAYRDAVLSLGRRYLADGPALVHGDYFPGSWLNAAGGVRVIDPEFCFLGDAELDCAILAAHLLLVEAGSGHIELIAASIAARRLDAALVAGYAGVEIMRRLIGVAQLPLPRDLDRKRSLLQHSRRLVLEPRKGLA